MLIFDGTGARIETFNGVEKTYRLKCYYIVAGVSLCLLLVCILPSLFIRLEVSLLASITRLDVLLSLNIKTSRAGGTREEDEALQICRWKQSNHSPTIANKFYDEDKLKYLVCKAIKLQYLDKLLSFLNVYWKQLVSCLRLLLDPPIRLLDPGSLVQLGTG